MPFLLLATTAINRPLLHSDNIKEWSDWICKLDKTWNIVWFINIDCIKALDSTFEQTKNNFKQIIDTNRIDLFFLPQKTPHFLTSCKMLAKTIKSYVDNYNIDNNDVIVSWLEDDWKLNLSIPDNMNIMNYIKLLMYGKNYLNMTYIRNNYIWALAPNLIKYNMWKELFYDGWINETRDIDPEHCIGLYYRSKFGSPDDLINITVINKKVGETFYTQSFMTNKNSYYTYIDDEYDIIKHKKNYISLADIKTKFSDKPVMIRIAPNMTIDGCNYARKFMDKHANLVKTKEGISFVYAEKKK